jgi:hypothetical protein
MKRLFIVIGLMCALISSCDRAKLERNSPDSVEYREIVEQTPDYTVYRKVVYRFESVSYDTIPARTTSTIETPQPSNFRAVEDAVDLNDVLDPEGEDLDLDWNYTPITEEIRQHLDSLGIYYDSNRGCYRRNANK